MRRVSNDESTGEKGAGADGFHIDGYYLEKPFLCSIMHHLSCSTSGNTLISPMREAIETLSPADREALDRLYFMYNEANDHMYYHPLLCKHPVTGDDTMVFHLGAGKCWELLDRE